MHPNTDHYIQITFNKNQFSPPHVPLFEEPKLILDVFGSSKVQINFASKIDSTWS